MGVLRPPAFTVDDDSPGFDTGEARLFDGVRSDSGFGGANFRMLSLRASGLLPVVSLSKWIVKAIAVEPDACAWEVGVSGHGECSFFEALGDSSSPFPSGLVGGGGARGLPGECNGFQDKVVGLVGGGLPGGSTSLTVLRESSVLLRSSRESASCITGDDRDASFSALEGELEDAFSGLAGSDPTGEEVVAAADVWGDDVGGDATVLRGLEASDEASLEVEVRGGDERRLPPVEKGGGASGDREVDGEESFIRCGITSSADCVECAGLQS